jgi:hypothetical protein
MPPDVVGEVLEQLKWERGASAVFRRVVCKGWQDAHVQRVRHMTVNVLPFNSAHMMSRFNNIYMA